MWRLVGALLLCGGGLVLGLGAAGELERRARDLEAWAQTLALLEGEMAFRLPSMPQLLETIAPRAPGPAGEALEAVAKGMDELGERPFEAIWSAALQEHRGGLTDDDTALLCRLAGVLSRCGWEEGRRGVETVRRSLLDRAAQARADLRREGRAYGTLGLALGAFLTILLL